VTEDIAGTWHRYFDQLDQLRPMATAPKDFFVEVMTPDHAIIRIQWDDDEEAWEEYDYDRHQSRHCDAAEFLGWLPE
jgi:hypothetical protein